MSVTIREATVEDAAIILRFVRELAAYEKLEHEVEATVDSTAQALFGPDSVSRAVICERDGAPIGFAVWFLSYSTWQARNGLYLEDLYVTPEARGTGAGRSLLRHLARIAVEKNCGRFEWSVLDWNEPAIRAYRAIGAEPMDGWTRYRLAGDALQAFAAG
ncbi:GCN5 family acetyltransferase [Rhizobium sp. Leaf384]|uniref:GNAT family N-acetyltransferase n=1 Tax=unclassified Rhizobium TaxID=2613769 RepID=UPI000713FE05|nr:MULTISPECIES: GNAT family N-acetyltransferase [unclassified Rhizobium]KQS77288.1 GCN5 family acetyltransferase [Rhizobium sp. Leaf383]KQS80789.1 GCN5 family acetyltransferase [Rhizobium sp. Leaf384]